ncbi:MAG: adenylosuccinate synthase [SAR324 cluster bacterium]|nr:adenylosuccinate synthase [SAR324 cluster bacterium]
MANAIVIGSQWGDEGKGKLVDILAEKADLVVRFQGGNNAGHTVKYADKKFVLHLIPSGVLHPNTNCLLGNGMVIDPEAFLEELDYLKDLGVDPTGQLFISDTAHLILPYHKALDQAREDRLRANKIGTTVRGIGPAYEDKVSRQGIRFIDIENTEAFKAKVDRVVNDKNLILKHVYEYEGPFLIANDVFENLLKAYETIAPFVVDGQEMLYEAVDKGQQVLFEGAQGTFLDIDHGTFPYVTSSNTTAGGACTGSGLPPNKVTDVIGVVKAYTTRVGSGPFPTELFDDDGAHLAKVGDEFGATTGRARRCGWFDLCMLKNAVAVNGLTKLAITKLDVLDELAVIKLCVAYTDPQGKTYTRLPHNSEVQATLTPVYEEIAGWQSNTVGTTNWDDLPENAIKYLNRISELLEVPLGMVSTGPKREETIILSNPFS